MYPWDSYGALGGKGIEIGFVLLNEGWPRFAAEFRKNAGVSIIVIPVRKRGLSHKNDAPRDPHLTKTFHFTKNRCGWFEFLNAGFRASM